MIPTDLNNGPTYPRSEYTAAPRTTLKDWALAGVILVAAGFCVLVALASLGLLAWAVFEIWRHAAQALRG